jgi:hypothetical protein
MRLKGNASSARRRDSRLEEPVSPLAVEPFATSAMTGSRGIADAVFFLIVGGLGTSDFDRLTFLESLELTEEKSAEWSLVIR